MFVSSDPDLLCGLLFLVVVFFCDLCGEELFNHTDTEDTEPHRED